MAQWQTEQLNTVNVTPDSGRQVFTIAVPSSGRYVLEAVGATARVGLWGGPIPVPHQNGLLGICGENVKGTHKATPAGVLSVSVEGLAVGSTQVRLRKFTFLDNWWSLKFFTLYKSTCSIASNLGFGPEHVR